MFCHKCDRKIPEHSIVCPFCATPIDSPATVQNIRKPVNSNEKPHQQEELKAIYAPKILVAFDHCFRKKIEITNQIFGKNYKAYQRACLKVGFGYGIWCPIISVYNETFNSQNQVYRIGKNVYNEEEGMIVSEYEFESGYSKKDFGTEEDVFTVLVFGHYLKKVDARLPGYYFLGQFKWVENDNPNISYCKRVSKELDLSPWNF